MTIYQRIKNLRESKGMSQQELAEKVGFKTASAVNKIELGLRDINQSKIKAFAEALGTTSCYLLDGKETSKDFVSSFALTEREKALVIAYREHPDMQKSVDRLLGIEPEEKLYIIEKAARNGDNSPLVVTDSKLKKLENLPEVPLEDG
jgi:transcriptional regulator with XRE-family HTH domain